MISEAITRGVFGIARDVQSVRIGDIDREGPHYQRPLKESDVRRIARDYDPGMIGEPELNVRDDGTVVVIDGQHRVEALRRKFGEDHSVKCRVHYGLDIETERKMYLARNYYSRNATRGDTFMTRYESGEISAVTTMRVIEEVGYRPYSKIQRYELPPGCISTSMVEYVINHSGENVARETLQIIKEAWGDWAGPQNLVRGVVVFLAQARKQPHFDPRRLTQILAVTTPMAVWREGKKEAARRDVSFIAGVAYHMREKYNHSLRGGRLEGLQFGSDKGGGT